MGSAQDEPADLPTSAAGAGCDHDVRVSPTAARWLVRARGLTDRAADGVVAALAVLAQRATYVPGEVDWVGAGPLEDLLSHSGNGAAVIDEVEQMAEQDEAFRAALRHVWLGDHVDPEVRRRLVPLGARDLTARGA